MENRTFRTVLGVLLSIIFVTACSPTQTEIPTTTLISATEDAQATATSPATEAPTTEGGAMPVAGEGQCANAYYPVRQGATWTYKSTGGPAGEYRFTDTITSVRDDGFTLSTQFGNRTQTQDWACRPEGLVALQLGGAPAAMLNSQNIQLNLDVTNTSGVTFPSQIRPGDQWQQYLDVEGNAAVASEEAEATGTAQMNFSAIGSESVTVPAGTFDALKIEVDVTLDLNASYEGITLPVTFSGDYTYWFAEGVGWVRATGTGSLFGSSFSEMIELQSFNIP